MKLNRHTEEQNISILKANERGVSITELARHRWKAEYNGMEVSEAKRLHELEAENARLNKLLAEASTYPAPLGRVAGRSQFAGHAQLPYPTQDVVGLVGEMQD